MKYKLTPINGTIIILFLYVVWQVFRVTFKEGLMWGITTGLMLIVAHIVVVIFALVCDYILQFFIKKYITIFYVELLIIGFIGGTIAWQYRPKTLILPATLESKYIAIVYGVEDAPPLPISSFTYGYEVVIPNSGIVLTSTKYYEDLQEIKMKSNTGETLGNDDSHATYLGGANEEFTCNNKLYSYTGWAIEQKVPYGTGIYSYYRDSMETQLRKVLCK